MNIGIDIDDTISDTYALAVPYAREFVKNELNREIKEDFTGSIDHHYIKNAFGLSNEEDTAFWDKFFLKIVTSAEPKDFAVEVISKLKESGNRIVIITARYGENAYEISEKWLKNNGIKYDKLIVKAKDKATVAKEENIDLFIDDSILNCESVSDVGIKSFLFSSKANQYYDIKKAQRVESWSEVYKKIKEEV